MESVTQDKSTTQIHRPGANYSHTDTLDLRTPHDPSDPYDRSNPQILNEIIDSDDPFNHCGPQDLHVSCGDDVRTPADHTHQDSDNTYLLEADKLLGQQTDVNSLVKGETRLRGEWVLALFRELRQWATKNDSACLPVICQEMERRTFSCGNLRHYANETSDSPFLEKVVRAEKWLERAQHQVERRTGEGEGGLSVRCEDCEVSEASDMSEGLGSSVSSSRSSASNDLSSELSNDTAIITDGLTTHKASTSVDDDVTNGLPSHTVTTTDGVTSHTVTTTDGVTSDLSSHTVTTTDGVTSHTVTTTDVTSDLSSHTVTTTAAVTSGLSSHTVTTTDGVMKDVTSHTVTTTDDVTSDLSSHTVTTTDDVTSDLSSHTVTTTDGVTSDLSSHTVTTTDDVMKDLSSHTVTTTDGVTSDLSSQTVTTTDGVMKDLSSHTVTTTDVKCCGLSSSTMSPTSLHHDSLLTHEISAAVEVESREFLKKLHAQLQQNVEETRHINLADHLKTNAISTFVSRPQDYVAHMDNLARLGQDQRMQSITMRVKEELNHAWDACFHHATETGNDSLTVSLSRASAPASRRSTS